MENNEFEDVLDDWFIESLKTYKDLHVYQLDHPTRVIEWTSGKTVCVAGYGPAKNEMLELRLPLKLLADENKGLCAERDFKVVHGGFTDGPVRRLKHVPGTRCVVTNDGWSSALQVWELGGDDSDVIRRTGSVGGGGSESASGSGMAAPPTSASGSRMAAPPTMASGSRMAAPPTSASGSRMAAPPSSPSRVLHGARSCDVRLTELSSGRTTYTLETASSDLLSSLHFVDDAVFLAACCNGRVYLGDTRTSAPPPPPQLLPSPASSGESSVQWWTDVSAGPHLSSCRVVRLSSSGRAEVSDWRNPAGGAVCQAQLDVETRRRHGPDDDDDFRVSWAPVLKGLVSVSGFDGDVQIYDSCDWTAEPRPVQPLFSHRGHAVSPQQGDDGAPARVTWHAWHPERPHTLMSAASDGSVHVWDWVRRTDADGQT